ncbi:Ig-like domain-containing protein, partial [Mycobacterium sp. E740]|uniref:Ig-like domain-containing protein n=1 Tax=Mycobacterium sp. E740 TaxID=1834149 RepID=UPI001E644216
MNVELQQLTARQAVTAHTRTGQSLPQTSPVASRVAVSAAPEEPTLPRYEVRRIVLGLLGFASPATDEPPADSPLGWALVAMGTRRRQLGQPAIEESGSRPVSSTLTGQTVDGLVTDDLKTARGQGDQPAAVEASTMQLSALATSDVARATVSADAAVKAVKTATKAIKPDTRAPTVKLTGPARNATVSGTVSLSAVASDNKGVAGVQFLVDNAPVGAEDTAGPYSASWDTTAVADGAHTLTARARDAAGNTTTSSVTVTVANVDTSAPSVSIGAPANGATVSGTVSLSAVASDNKGVAGVQFLVDDAPVGAEDTAGPYSASWDTTAVADGAHTLTARARDAAGNTTTSSVTVTVANVDTSAPSVSIGAPANGATVSGTVSLSAVASDNKGVAGVQFLVDDAPLGAEDTAGPYSASWDTTAVADGTHTLTARARDAAGNTTTSSVTVTVANADSTAPTVTVIGNITLRGWITGKPPLMTPDGTRVLITTYEPSTFGSNTTTLASVIDTRTGTRLGTVPVTGWVSSSLLSANGSRAVIVGAPDSVNGQPSNITNVAVIDPVTGAQLGTTLTLAGNAVGAFMGPQAAMLSADGTRALITTANYNQETLTPATTTWVTVVDTTTGAQIGTKFTLPGDPWGFLPLNAQGTSALITTRVYDATRRTYSTRVAVLNTDGTQTGTTLTLDVDATSGPPLKNADGTRVLITDSTYGTPYTSRVAVIDTTTGAQVGTTLTLTGELASDSRQLAANGTRAMFITTVTDAGGAITATRLTVVNTATGAQTGTTLILPGSGGVQVSADGRR